MNHPEQVVCLATAATDLEPQPADAAAILVDAAAMCASQCGLKLDDLIIRLSNSHTTMVEAKAAVEMLGSAAATQQ